MKLESKFMTNCSVHGRRITIFKFDIYLLMVTENFFIVILGLLGHNRKGKTCAPIMFGFLRHPTPQFTQMFFVYQTYLKIIHNMTVSSHSFHFTLNCPLLNTLLLECRSRSACSVLYTNTVYSVHTLYCRADEFRSGSIYFALQLRRC